jgi:hypothetical protein
MKLTDLAKRTVQHVLIYGEPKSGKSTLASKLANKYKLIWISNDQGHSVLYKLPKEAQANIDIIVLPDTREMPVAYDVLNKLLELKPTSICRTHGVVNCSVCKKNAPAEFDTYDFSKLDADTIVVIDHISRVADSVMNNLTKNQKVDEKFTFNDYGAQGMHMAALLAKLQNAPFNFVAIAQPIEAEDEAGRKRLYPQMGTRNFSTTSSQYFDSMVLCEVTNKSHKNGSKTTYSTSAITGSRNDVAIEDMKEPSLIPFFEVTAEQAVAAKAAKLAEEKAVDKTEATAVLSTLGSRQHPQQQPVAASATQEPKPAAGATTGMTAASAAAVNAIGTQLVEVAVAPKSAASATAVAQSMKDRLAALKGNK